MLVNLPDNFILTIDPVMEFMLGGADNIQVENPDTGIYLTNTHNFNHLVANYTGNANAISINDDLDHKWGESLRNPPGDDADKDVWREYHELNQRMWASRLPDYGVCDNYEQFLERVAKPLIDSDRQFFVSFTRVYKAAQPESGGWRWHKWGEYCGDYDNSNEYLYDSPDAEVIYCYHVHELING